jgi:hypothetical protein
VFASAGQSASLQHVVFPMQRLLQTLSPAAQEQVPPGPEHVSPVTLQSVVVQQLAVGMHALLAAQKVWPVGQLHEPPGPEHVPPPTQSALVQHVPWAMQELNGGDAIAQTDPLLGQVQLPPGPVQDSPVTRQSLLVQHVLVGMHELLTVQTLLPAGQPQAPPGAEHVSLVTVQSALVQHAVLGMHALLPMQAL